MRLHPLLLAVPAALLIAAPAAAKEIRTAKVCGADGCHTIHKIDESMLGGAPTAIGPVEGEPFVRFVFVFGQGDETFPARELFVPHSGLMRSEDDGDNTWLAPTELARLRREAGRVKPFPASKFPADALSPADPPAVVPAPAAVTKPAQPARHQADNGGLAAWWIVALSGSAAIALAIGWTRRRRRAGPAATA